MPAEASEVKDTLPGYQQASLEGTHWKPHTSLDSPFRLPWFPFKTVGKRGTPKKKTI